MTAMTERVAATRRIAAPAAAIFAVVTDPQGHVRIDGSGMLVSVGSGEPVRAVGDAFEMEMDREPLGDLPLGRYRTRNVITRFVPDRELEWSVGGVDRPPYGHVYGYLLTPVTDQETDVTSYCDWSGVPEHRKARSTWPIVPVSMLEKSLVNLERVVTG